VGVIRFCESGDDAFVEPATVYPAAVLPLIPDRELEGTRVKMHHPGADAEPQLFEVQVDPDLELASHAHDTDEIIVVVEGELRFGSRVCPAGTSILVPGDTLYSVRSGPDGARFLNFRGAADYTYLDKDLFMARRRERGETTGPEGEGDR
jgi:hypothetical protein